MTSKKNRVPVSAGKTYHIYNRGNNYETTFFTRSDYMDFLNSFQKYFASFVDVYAYTLVPDHFHLLIGIHKNSQLTFYKEYQRFILHFVRRINFTQKRLGSLFLNPYKRYQVESEDDFRRLIYYIHYNPVKHGIVKEFHRYIFSSYLTFLNYKSSNIKKDYVFNIFGGQDAFFEFHSKTGNLLLPERVCLED